jgi:gamma-glutamylaminecyclotransferase
MTTHTDLLFVFGTLKQGFRNAHINQGQRLPGRFATCLPHPLYIVGPRCLPWLLALPGQGLPVTGELYTVDASALAQMDKLERIDTPGWYERRRVEVRAEGTEGPALSPWVYFGSAAGFSGLQVHAGPLAEYLPSHERSFPPRAE